MRPIRVLSHALLLGCFPGNHGRTAGVFCTISKDGVDWARPVLLVTSELHNGRIGDQLSLTACGGVTQSTETWA